MSSFISPRTPHLTKIVIRQFKIVNLSTLFILSAKLLKLATLKK